MAVNNYCSTSNKIVEIFESAEAGKWERPWNTAGGFPKNTSTQKRWAEWFEKAITAQLHELLHRYAFVEILFRKR